MAPATTSSPSSTGPPSGPADDRAPRPPQGAARDGAGGRATTTRPPTPSIAGGGAGTPLPPWLSVAGFQALMARLDRMEAQAAAWDARMDAPFPESTASSQQDPDEIRREAQRRDARVPPRGEDGLTAGEEATTMRPPTPPDAGGGAGSLLPPRGEVGLAFGGRAATTHPPTPSDVGGGAGMQLLLRGEDGPVAAGERLLPRGVDSLADGGRATTTMTTRPPTPSDAGGGAGTQLLPQGEDGLAAGGRGTTATRPPTPSGAGEGAGTPLLPRRGVGLAAGGRASYPVTDRAGGRGLSNAGGRASSPVAVRAGERGQGPLPDGVYPLGASVRRQGEAFAADRELLEEGSSPEARRLHQFASGTFREGAGRLDGGMDPVVVCPGPSVLRAPLVQDVASALSSRRAALARADVAPAPMTMHGLTGDSGTAPVSSVAARAGQSTAPWVNWPGAGPFTPSAKRRRRRRRYRTRYRRGAVSAGVIWSQGHPPPLTLTCRGTRRFVVPSQDGRAAKAVLARHFTG